MPCFYFGSYKRVDTRKPWRYPGTPIPYRLRDRYK